MRISPYFLREVQMGAELGKAISWQWMLTIHQKSQQLERMSI